MTTNTQPGSALSLGDFLRDRRARLSPGPGAQGRRRTPGLRREEVAAKAGVSVTWYTWLEQGRGGPPSDSVLERLTRALELDAAGREVLYLLAQQRPPPLNHAPVSAVTPALQRVLDGMPFSPAIIKTVTWDIVAWNPAANAVLGNYQDFPARDRNVLRRLFDTSRDPSILPHWEMDARFAISVFRMDLVRAGRSPDAEALVAELSETNSEFRRLWAEKEMRTHWVGGKQLHHPVAGQINLETSAYAVDGADGLSMIIFTPISAEDRRAVEGLLAREPEGG